MKSHLLPAAAGLVVTASLVVITQQSVAAESPPFDVAVHGHNQVVDDRGGLQVGTTISTTSKTYRITTVTGSAVLGSSTVPFDLVQRDSDSRVRASWTWSNDAEHRMPVGTWRSVPITVSWVKKSDPSVNGSFVATSRAVYRVRQESRIRDVTGRSSRGTTVITGRAVYYSSRDDAWVRAKSPAVVLQTRLSSSDPWKDLKRVRASTSGWVRATYRYRRGEGRHFQLRWDGWDTTWGASSLGQPRDID